MEGEVTIGRSQDADLVLDDPRVSRSHALLRCQGDTLSIEDLGSSAGTKVNGLDLIAPLDLAPADEITIGSHSIRVLGVQTESPSRRPSPSVPPTPPRAAATPAANKAKVLTLSAVMVLTAIGGVLFFTRPGDDPPPGRPARIAEAMPTSATPASPPASPNTAPPAVEQRPEMRFRDALAKKDLKGAQEALSASGDRADLKAQLESALVQATESARKDSAELVRQNQNDAAAAHLRAVLATLPRGTKAHTEVTELLLEVPATLKARGVDAEPVVAKNEEPPRDPKSDGVKPPSTETAPTRRLPATDSPKTPEPGTPGLDPAIVADLEAAETALKDRDLDRAVAGFDTVRKTLGESPKSSSRALGALKRCERGERSVANFRAGIAALVQVFKTSPASAGLLPHVAGENGNLLAISDTEICVSGPKEQRTLRWRVVPLSTLKALAKAAALTPADLVHVAGLLQVVGASDEAQALLVRALEKDAALKPEIDQILADARRFPEVPPGGFELVEGRFLSPEEVERRALVQKIGLASKTLASDDAEKRKAAFQTLQELGDVARSELHLGLLRAQSQLEEKLQKLPGYSPLQNLAEQREELDRRRKAALDLIFDEAKYPYPKDPPEATAAAHAAYLESQPEVEALTTQVRELWREEKTYAIPAPVRESVSRIIELREWMTQSELIETKDFAAWLCHLPEQSTMSIQTIAVSAADRKRIDESLAIIGVTDPTNGVATPGELAQWRVTNAYRLLLGRIAVRLHVPLVRAARGHCVDMVKFGFFAHESPVPGKQSPSDRIRLEGMQPEGLSENIAVSGSPEGAHQGWLRSPGHHRNILGTHWKLLGTGNSGNKWCQNFAGGDSATAN